MHVPAATSVSVVPLTAQTAGEVDAKLTASPELAVADSGAGAVPKVWVAGEVKLMLWAISGAVEMVMLRVTSLAWA